MCITNYSRDISLLLQFYYYVYMCSFNSKVYLKVFNYPQILVLKLVFVLFIQGFNLSG